MATVSQPTSTQQPAQEIITAENMETPLLENDGVHTESNSSLPQQTPQVNSNIGHEQLSSGNKAQEQEQETRAIYKTNIYVFLPPPPPPQYLLEISLEILQSDCRRTKNVVETYIYVLVH